MSQKDVLREPIGIIGAGVAGLINAHVLLQDGFTDITLISRDGSIGGTWSRERVYPGLLINNVHGEYRFSALDMALPENCTESGGRLSGMDICNYMEKFYKTFLENKATFLMETEVVNVQREENGLWNILVEDIRPKTRRILSFSRIILASGGCSNPKIPELLSQETATKSGYHGIVLHSSQFSSRLDDILSVVQPTSSQKAGTHDKILVIGGGKSARDICAKLANEGRKPLMVFDETDVVSGSKSPAPAFIRKGRLISVLSPHKTLNSRLERFLHTTTLGAVITRFFWKKMEESSFSTFRIPDDSPLRRTRPLFWDVRSSDEGTPLPNCFHSLVNAGMIEMISPTRALGYSDDGKSILLSTGQVVDAKVVILATGYKSSWSEIFTVEMAKDLGIDGHTPVSKCTTSWKYKSLRNPPPLRPENKKWVTSIYRGIIPAKNINRRDFAIAGALFTGNFGYTNEVVAHWIASYFRGDDMRLPSSPEDAIAKAEEQSAWMRTRYPTTLSWANESYSTSLDFFTWPQAVDELLEDMHLPGVRSGGNWFNWVFKVMDVSEIAHLANERSERRLVV